LLCFECFALLRLLARWLVGWRAGFDLFCLDWLGLWLGSAWLGFSCHAIGLSWLGWAWLGLAGLGWACFALLCFALLCFALLCFACLLACLSDCLFACLLARLLACRGWGGGLHFLTTCNFQQTHRRNRSPPEVAPGGGTKQTKFQKLQALSDDRARVRKAFETAGGSSNKHFAIDCSLYHSTQRGGAPNYRWTRVLLFVLKSPFKSDANAPRKRRIVITASCRQEFPPPQQKNLEGKLCRNWLAESQGMAAHHGAQGDDFNRFPYLIVLIVPQRIL